jgi:hypothetical protein
MICPNRFPFFAIMRQPKTTNTGKASLSGVRTHFAAAVAQRNSCELGLRLDSFSNLKRTDQNGANKRKRGAHRQHIQPQGHVHARPPSLLNIVK